MTVHLDIQHSRWRRNSGTFHIDNNGDISFYEDTGTTPKFVWDSSAESLGVGNSSPSQAIVDAAKGIRARGSPNFTLQETDALINMVDGFLWW
jgi:hypothetical protein